MIFLEKSKIYVGVRLVSSMCGNTWICTSPLANPKKLDINYIKILCDSQAAIKALNKPRITSQSQQIKALDNKRTRERAEGMREKEKKKSEIAVL